MHDCRAFVLRSTEKVIAHCETLLKTQLPAQERARLIARVEDERQFAMRLTASPERHAA